MSSEKKKNRLFIAAIVIILAVLQVVFMYISNSFPDIENRFKYGKGIDLISEGRYEEAENFFNVLYKKDWEKYSDAYHLGDYARYLQYKGKDLAKESYYINGASNYYSGPLSDEMLAEKEIDDKKCREYTKEQRAAFNEDPWKYKDTIPFIGMNSMYIDRTRLGTHCKVKKGSRLDDGIYYDTYEYTFGTVYGDLLLMEVTCTDRITECVVTYVKKYNEAYLWHGDVPDVIASEYKDQDKQNGSNSHYSGINGGYDYNDFEDFYYDNEEDFDSLDDAEDYYNEHYDDFD